MSAWRWQALPEPFSKVQVEVNSHECTISYFAKGTPEDLVASGIAKPEWIPAWYGGKQKWLPDGGHCFWARRGKKARTWMLACYFKSAEAARRMPGVPPDITLVESDPQPTPAAGRPEQEFTVAEWKDRIMSHLQQGPLAVAIELSGALRGSDSAFTWCSGRFALDPAAVADLVALQRNFHRSFIERFAKARIIDRQKAAPGLRLIVDNTRH